MNIVAFIFELSEVLHAEQWSVISLLLKNCFIFIDCTYPEGTINWVFIFCLFVSVKFVKESIFNIFRLLRFVKLKSFEEVNFCSWLFVLLEL